ncbi:MAG: hypothetical protein AB7I27_04800 [Bacteriovoracaceae bacterium]
MSNKQTVENKRRAHAAKVLQKMNRSSKAEDVNTTARKAKREAGEVSALKEQYNEIRKDLIKLRQDLSKGYGLAKTMMERKGFVKQFLKTK